MKVRQWQKWLFPILWPLSLVYSFATRMRARLYSSGLKKPVRFNLPIISVGNIAVGGTGKTPFTFYLVSRLKKLGYTPAIVSRGYGRSTKGVYHAEEDANPAVIGDEPSMLYYQLKQNTPIVVAEQRVLGISEVISRYPEVNLIVLDDGFQHLPVQRDINLVLTTTSPSFVKDYPFPAGMLREPRTAIQRADAIVVTKSNTQEFKIARNAVQSVYGLPVFEAKSKLGEPIPVDQTLAKLAKPEKYVLFSGIGIPDSFENLAEKNLKIVGKSRYPDHHRYTEADVLNLLDQLKGTEKTGLLCTAKDAVKLKDFRSILPWLYYLPLDMKVAIEQQDAFWEFITHKLEKHENRNS